MKEAFGPSALQAGVTDKWHWTRNATIYANILGRGTVASVRETQEVSLNGRRSDSVMTMAPLTPAYSAIKPWLKATCVKDNSWFADSYCNETLVIWTTWTTGTTSNSAFFYHAADDLYWWKYERRFYIRDIPNPSTPDGVWYAPEGSYGYVGSANFNCDQGFPFSEVCRFN